MQLYQSVGPNPRVVTMFIAEKAIAVERTFVDILAGENRQPPFLARNPAGHTPLLELGEGNHLVESLAICEYLDELHPSPPLIGASTAERAQTRALLRQIDQNVVVPMTIGFRGAEGLPMFKDRLLCVPDAAAGTKQLGQSGLAALDQRLGTSQWLLGNRFTLADILLFCFAEFGGQVDQPIPSSCSNLSAWQARVAARPSAAISADPMNGD